MKQPMQEKYTVAWFKLAEFVARGEKERALGLYRLLAHSFDDIALTHQLEGDILNAFNDQSAVEAYQRAIDYYLMHNRLVEAVALYEQLNRMQPYTVHGIKEAIKIYKKLNQPHALFHAYRRLIAAYAEHKKFYEFESLIIEMQRDLSQADLACAFEHMCAELISKQANAKTIEWVIEQAVMSLVEHAHSARLYSFMDHLKDLDGAWHDYAAALM